MKKLAKFMALVMCVSSFGSFGLTSANAEVLTADDMKVNVIDFSDKAVSANWWIGASCFNSTATGAVLEGVSGESGNSYQKIDEEHGTSLAMTGGAGIGYVFNRTFDAEGNAVKNPVTGRIHYSFDVYAKQGDATSQAVLQFNKYAYNWDTQIIDFQAKNNAYKLPQHGRGDTLKETFSSGNWYRIDLNIDAKADSAVVDVFVNGKYKSTANIPEAINSVWLSAKNLGVGTSNSMLVDNIRVQTEAGCDFANAIDFNEKKVSSNVWAGETYSSADATGGVILRNGDSGASYQKIDDEHAVSYAMTGGASFRYVFNRTFDENNAAVENAVTGKFKLSFDMYNKLDAAKTGRVALQVNNYSSYNEDSMIAYFQYSSSKYAAVDKSGTLTWGKAFVPEAWYKVDLEFDATQTSTKVSLYLDNEYIGAKTYNVPLKYIGLFSNASESKCYTAIDNVEVSAVADVRDLTAAPVAASINEDAESVSVRYTGTLDRDSVNDEPEVLVSEYDKDTGTSRTVDAYAEIDYTATKLNVYFNEKLNDNSELTITLPTALKGLFAEDIATETVKVTTKMGLDYFDDFDSYTNAAKMTRFNGREFSGAEGYMGGQALTSEYNQTTIFYLPEAITVDKATTDYIISFDMKIPDDLKYIQLYASYNSGSAYQWKAGNVYREWNDTGDFTKNNWHHYDLVFDFDGSDDASGRKRFQLYQDGVNLTSKASFGLWETLSYVKLYAEVGYPYYIDNFHARYRNEVEVTTNLTGAVSPSVKEAFVKFDDAMDVQTLTNNNIWIEDENGDEVDCTVTASGVYGASVKFEDGVLEKDNEYTLVINGVKTCAGEPISGLDSEGNKIFNFKTEEKFEVTAAKIKNGSTVIDAVSKWDKLTAYSVELTLDSTRLAEQTIYAVVAGYKQSGELVNVGVTPVKVSGSDVYTEDLEAIDMTDADFIKIFAVDGFENFSPLMAQAVVLN